MTWHGIMRLVEQWKEQMSAYFMIPGTKDTQSSAPHRLPGVALVWRSMAAGTCETVLLSRRSVA